MTQHTPGPWTVNGPWHIQADTTYDEYKQYGYAPKVVAQIVQGHNISLDEREANAALIAAAPAMLEALKVALEDINKVIEDDVLANLVASPDDHGLSATHRIVWQAIAQAEGKH
jgi:hypothetical protein